MHSTQHTKHTSRPYTHSITFGVCSHIEAWNVLTKQTIKPKHTAQHRTAQHMNIYIHKQGSSNRQKKTPCDRIKRQHRRSEQRKKNYMYIYKNKNDATANNRLSCSFCPSHSFFLSLISFIRSLVWFLCVHVVWCASDLMQYTCKVVLMPCSQRVFRFWKLFLSFSANNIVIAAHYLTTNTITQIRLLISHLH